MTSSRRLEIILNHLHGCSPISEKRTSVSNYRYTVDNSVLTNEQRMFYEENGYVLISNLIDHCLIDECRNRFIDICNGTVDKGRIVSMKEKSLINTDAKGEYLINKLQDIMFDDVFIKYAQNALLLKYVECFTGPDITAIQSMVINKPPSNGCKQAVHPMHQDLYYFPIRPADRIVASWTAMEQVTVDNGCLFVVPGSHRSKLLPHEYPEYEVNHMFYEVKDIDSVSPVNLEINKGDTVFFHPLLCHGSGPNITKGFRKVISCHYASSNCHFLENPDASQNLVMKDIQKSAKLTGLDLSNREILQLRQMLVKGKPGNLQHF